MRGARPETPSLEEGVAVRDSAPVLWAKVIDHRKCIGCHACTLACKAEHLVPLGVNRTYVKQVEVGGFPAVQRHFQITRCNQCDDPPCVHICPTGAMFRRRDGIVDFDRSICIGCKACMAACPYDAIYIDPVSKSAEKCNFCAHRIDMGLEPACVVVCPVEAIVVGPLNGDGSEVREILTREHVTVRKPEKGTRPKLFYIDGHDATLVPGAAAHPPLYAFAENPNRAHASLSLGSAPQGMVDLNLLQEVATYEAPGKPPWGWMVSAYLWTKSLAAGFFLLPALLAWIGAPPGEAVGTCLDGTRSLLACRHGNAARGRPHPPGAVLPDPAASPLAFLAQPGGGDHHRIWGFAWGVPPRHLLGVGGGHPLPPGGRG